MSDDLTTAYLVGFHKRDDEFAAVTLTKDETIRLQAEDIERLKYQLGIVRKSREHWLKKYTSLRNVVLKELDVSDAPEENND